MWRAKFPPILLYSISLVGFYASAVLAQTVPDHTLGSESSTVDQDVTIGNTLVDLIEGGAIRGNNLFHSFSEFNVGDGSAVYFASPDGIANILTRVTGNNPSEIFGTLGVDGAANLFLLNPNGIVFGENAALDLNGSFLTTTADSYIFENDFAYSASNPNLPPLLTVNIPVGLQFGNQAEAIVNKSIAFNDVEETVGLEVFSERNISLIGGDILFEGGYLTAPNGNIEIGSIVPNNTVKIIPTENNWNLDYTGINNFQHISLTQGAGVITSGNGAGNINIQGNKLSVLGGSRIAANNLGELDGGNLTINAAASLEVNGINDDGATSSITTEIYDAGKGANLTINTGTLQVTDGASISANNYGIGDGGDLTIDANESITVGSENENYSYISTDVYSSGDGGNLTIETGTLKVKDLGIVDSTVWIPDDVVDIGDGGDVTIKASDSVEVVGINSEDFDNVIASGVYLLGDRPLEELNLEPDSANGGNLAIETGSLWVVNGGIVTADNFGSGKGGSLTINASELVEVIGNSAEAIQSYISTSVYGTADGGDFNINTGTLRIVDDAYVDSITYAQGNGGTLTVNADRVIVKDGGQLAVGIFGGQGNAGNLIVNATESVEVSGAATRLLMNETEGEVFFDTSSLFASADSQYSGNGGNIIIETPTLKLFDGGGISTSTNSDGNGGNITIRANIIEVANRIQDSFGEISGINSLASTEATGNGGSIDIVADRLQIVDGGLISVASLGEGNAGNIKINAQNIDITGVSSGEPFFGVKQESVSSTISAFSEGDFDAGSINISSNTLNIGDRGNISVSNLGNGNSGNLNIIAKELNLNNSASLEAKVNAGSQGNIRLTTDNIFLRNNSEINVLATGTATGGNIKISNRENMVVTKNSKIIADALQGNGGNIEITSQGYFVSEDSLVSARSEVGLDGNINVDNIDGDRPLELDQLPANLVDRTQQIAKTCGGRTNQFAIAGRGGLPENPWQNLRGQTVWQDLRLIAIDTSKTSQVQADQASIPILEAQAWKINDLGQIELIAINADVPRLDNQGSCQ